MRLIRTWVCCAVLAPNVFLVAAEKKPVTIEDAAAQSPSSQIRAVWSPDGSAFLYADGGAVHVRRGGADSVWFKTSALEEAAKPRNPAGAFGWQNRRVSSDSYQWFPDGKDLLASAHGELFTVHPGGKFEKLATHTPAGVEDPKLSPDGKRVLYRLNSNLYVFDLQTRKTLQLTRDGSSTLLNGQLDWVYPEELDLGTASWWSPDSRHIAYLQFDTSHEFVYPQVDLLGERAVSEPERYPQAGTANALVRLGVVAAAGGATKWMNVGETSSTLLPRVAWLPDSGTVAVERLTRIQDRLDLLFCNPQTGAARTILQEKSKTWINTADNLQFLKSAPEFLWTSERSGFRHLYRYANSGKLVKQITSGEWQVNGIAGVNEQTETIYYTSSESGPLGSELYSVSLQGGERTRLTKPDGSHYVSMNATGSAYVDTFSNAKQPPQTVLVTTATGENTVLRGMDRKAFDSFDLLPSEVVQVPSGDGVTLYARLTRPANFKQGARYPVIVSVYGGPGVQVIRDSWSGVTWDQAMAHKGYVIWQLDNRGSTGRGHAFEEPLYRQFGKQEVADQVTGAKYLIGLGIADPERIGITGWSYGGYMTIHSMLLAPELFRVGVAGAPVTNWRNYDTIYTERYLGLPGENKEGYAASSNLEPAAKLKGKLLILHNFEDDNVLFQNTMQMVNALEAAGKQYSMQLYPQKTHGVTGAVRKTLMQAMADYFDQNLK